MSMMIEQLPCAKVEVVRAVIATSSKASSLFVAIDNYRAVTFGLKSFHFVVYDTQECYTIYKSILYISIMSFFPMAQEYRVEWEV